MVFMCNSCFALVDKGQMPGGPTQIRNKECLICAKQCNTATIEKDMPLPLKIYFEPPLTKIEKVQQQLRFLQNQQAITPKLKQTFDESEKKKEKRMIKILELEQQTKAEEQRLIKVVKEKMEKFRQLKEKFNKLNAEEQRYLKFFEENGWPVDKNVSADSGVHSFEKSGTGAQQN